MSESRIPAARATPRAQQLVETIDLHKYWRTIIRRRWILIPFFVTTMAVTAVYTLRLTKIYDAVCTIIIDLQAPRVLDKEQVQEVVETGTGGYWYSREYYETQYRVILSRAVAQRVVDKLQLAMNDRFLGAEEASAPAQKEAVRRNADPAKILISHLRVEPVKESRVARLRYEDPDPRFAAQVANAVAEAYIAESMAVRSTTTGNASEWLEQQMVDLERKLTTSSKTLFDFKRSHDIVATSWEDRQSIISQRLTVINDALTKARVRLAELQAKNEGILALGGAVESGQGEVESLPAVAASRTIQDLKVLHMSVRSECADLRVKYLEDHPKLEACAKKLALTQQGLKDEVRLALATVQKEYQETAKTQRNLQKLLEETKSDAFGLNQYEREYQELKRAHDNNQRLYDMVLKRLKDTDMAGLLNVSNVRILDRAQPSLVPIRPSVGRNLVLAAIFGLLGGIGLAFLVEYLDRTITSQQQVEEKLGLTFLGIVPSIERSKDGTSQDLFVHALPKSAAAECLRAVRTNLLFMSPEKALRTILVTSSGPQEGKTTTATSLAVTMANSGNRVLLVDADMRRPRVHRIFGKQNKVGLSSLILGEGKLPALVQETGIDNLWVLPCGPIPPNPAELLHTTAFKRIVAEMAAAYDRVIIDSPPVGVVADSVVMATLVDGTLVVLKAGKTDLILASQAVKQLRDVNAPIFGAVLNDLDLADQKYGQYSYYYQYGYYYGEGKGRETKPQAAKA